MSSSVECVATALTFSDESLSEIPESTVATVVPAGHGGGDCAKLAVAKTASRHAATASDARTGRHYARAAAPRKRRDGGAASPRRPFPGHHARRPTRAV